MQDKLTQLEKKYGVDWREYSLVGEHGIFQYDRGVRQVKTERFAGSIPLVTAGYENAGVAEFVKSGNSKLFDENTLTIDMFGNPFYRGYKYYADDNIISLQNKSFSKNVLLYISSNLMYLTKFYNYGKQFRIGELQKVKITLPTTNEEIAFDYIDEFIATLEAERLATLEAYLKATGLNNVELSVAERASFDKLGVGSVVSWREFRIGDLFEIATGRDFIIGRTISGDIPLISHQHENNGITKYVATVSDRRIFNHETTISLADRGVFYATTQNVDFHIGTRVKALTFKDGIHDVNERLFVVSAINKLQILFTEYSSNATDKLPDFSISLPARVDGTPDFEFMTTLIKAMQKVVIKGVVEWAEKKSKVMKGVIGNE